MGYRIEYPAPDCEKRKNRRWLVLICLVLAVILAGVFFPGVRQVVTEALIPGEAAVTIEALENLAENLSAGETISQALQTFCQQVIDGAQIPTN